MVDVKLSIWDPPGDQYFTLTIFYKGANGVLLVFDLANKESFYSDKFREIIEFVRDQTSAPIILVGNKLDLVGLNESSIREEDIKNLQETYNISQFILTSAKTGVNVDAAFNTLVDTIMKEKDMQDTSELTLKICLAGLSSVGKTSITNRYIGQSFQADYKKTVGVDLFSKTIEYGQPAEGKGAPGAPSPPVSDTTEPPKPAGPPGKPPTTPKPAQEIASETHEEVQLKKKIKVDRRKKRHETNKEKVRDRLSDEEMLEKSIEDMPMDADEMGEVDELAKDRGKRELTPAPGGAASMIPEKSEDAELVKKIERKATVFYKERMNPMKLNKMAVIISTKELYEALKIEKEKVIRAATDKTYEIEEEKPILYVEPIIPGCICVPTSGKLDATKEYDHETFLITPLEVGEIPEARVDIFYKDRLIDSIPTPITIVKTTMVKITSFIALLFPIISLLFEESLDSLFQVVIPFYASIGGLEGIIAILTGAFALISAMFYYFKRPKDASPAESKSLPSVVNAVSED
ncbi:MAG: membrane protein of unknown function [Promethearchaeota archaeon]|nr:MAG: membrane protein of unknown function [Candidatus Lokiarchaeota archaeon]